MNMQLHTYLCGIILLSGLDCLLTILWTEIGIGTELNPLMNALLQIHPLLFATIKILLVSGGVVILWYFRGHRFTLPGAIIGFICYIAVILQHINGFLLYCYWRN